MSVKNERKSNYALYTVAITNKSVTYVALAMPFMQIVSCITFLY